MLSRDPRDIISLDRDSLNWFENSHKIFIPLGTMILGAASTTHFQTNHFHILPCLPCFLTLCPFTFLTSYAGYSLADFGRPISSSGRFQWRIGERAILSRRACRRPFIPIRE
jgi:hypothetical protein